MKTYKFRVDYFDPKIMETVSSEGIFHGDDLTRARVWIREKAIKMAHSKQFKITELF